MNLTIAISDNPFRGCEGEGEGEEYYHLITEWQRGIIDAILKNRALEKMEEFRRCKSDRGCGAGQLVSHHTQLLRFVAAK